MSKFRVYDKQEKKYPDYQPHFYIDSDGDLFFDKNKMEIHEDLSLCDPDRYVVERFMITHINGDIEIDLYVGDIVYIAGKGNCIVVYDENACCFCFEKDGEYYEYQDEIEDIEKIIGNIHGETDGKD